MGPGGEPLAMTATRNPHVPSTTGRQVPRRSLADGDGPAEGLHHRLRRGAGILHWNGIRRKRSPSSKKHGRKPISQPILQVAQPPVGFQQEGLCSGRVPRLRYVPAREKPALFINALIREAYRETLGEPPPGCPRGVRIAPPCATSLRPNKLDLNRPRTRSIARRRALPASKPSRGWRDRPGGCAGRTRAGTREPDKERAQTGPRPR